MVKKRFLRLLLTLIVMSSIGSAHANTKLWDDNNLGLSCAMLSITLPLMILEAAAKTSAKKKATPEHNLKKELKFLAGLCLVTFGLICIGSSMEHSSK